MMNKHPQTLNRMIHQKTAGLKLKYHSFKKKYVCDIFHKNEGSFKKNLKSGGNLRLKKGFPPKGVWETENLFNFWWRSFSVAKRGSVGWGQASEEFRCVCEGVDIWRRCQQFFLHSLHRKQ